MWVDSIVENPNKVVQTRAGRWHIVKIIVPPKIHRHSNDSMSTICSSNPGPWDPQNQTCQQSYVDVFNYSK